MILELDCGNSFIKWRVIQDSDGYVVAGGGADSEQVLVADIQSSLVSELRLCRLVSVRTEEETSRLIDLLVAAFSVRVIKAQSSLNLAGVKNGYEDPARLGLDRWLALVGGYRIAGGACLVLDLGTAVTADFVTHAGEHLGGFICPGLPLMRNQLRTHTRRIRYDDVSAVRAMHELSPGRSTVEAVERGCALMLQGFALAQVELGRKYLGDDFRVFLTGGDAPIVSEALPGAQVLPDLVFAGLALACPEI